MKISRRSFLKGSAATTAAMALPGGIVSSVLANQASTELTPGPGNKWPGRVVINFNKNAVQGTSKIVDTAAQQMINDSILKLTGESTIGGAWKAVFPASLSAQSKIAIKVYCANTAIPTHWQAVKAVTDGLQQMESSGTKFAAANISLYEGNAGNNLSSAGFTAANFPGVKIEYWGTGKFVDGTGNEAAGAIKDRAYASTLKNADFLINIFNPHGHESKYGAFSIGFKNHFGTYDLAKPLDIHYVGDSNASQLCQQAIRDMNCTGPLLKKTVLNICCGIVGMNESHGPMGSADDFSTYSKAIDPSSTCKCPTTVIMSTDPISCEMQTVKMMRMNKAGGKYGITDMPKYLQASGGVAGALPGTSYNIGVIDETKMEIRRIINGVTSIAEHPPVTQGRPAASLKVSALSGAAATFIEYRLAPQHIGEESSLAIFSMSGTLVRRESLKVLGALNHFSWDHKTPGGSRAPAGKYIVQVTCGTTVLSEAFAVAR